MQITGRCLRLVARLVSQRITNNADCAATSAVRHSTQGKARSSKSQCIVKYFNKTKQVVGFTDELQHAQKHSYFHANLQQQKKTFIFLFLLSCSTCSVPCNSSLHNLPLAAGRQPVQNRFQSSQKFTIQPGLLEWLQVQQAQIRPERRRRGHYGVANVRHEQRPLTTRRLVRALGCQLCATAQHQTDHVQSQLQQTRTRQSTSSRKAEIYNNKMGFYLRRGNTDVTQILLSSIDQLSHADQALQILERREHVVDQGQEPDQRVIVGVTPHQADAVEQDCPHQQLLALWRQPVPYAQNK